MFNVLKFFFKNILFTQIFFFFQELENFRIIASKCHTP